MTDFLSIRRPDATSAVQQTSSTTSSTLSTESTIASKAATNESELVELDFDDEKDKKILRQDFIQAALPAKLQGADPTIVFDYLDKNKEGFILKSKLDSLSSKEISDLISQSTPKADNNNNQVGNGNNNNNQVGNNNGIAAGNGVSGNKSPAGTGSTGTGSTGAGATIADPNALKGTDYSETENVEALTQKKNEVNQTADKEINGLQTEKDTLINNKLSDELKAEHQAVVASIAAANNELTQIRANISKCESRIHTADCKISQIESELSSLSTNGDSGSDNAEIQRRRAARKSQLEGELRAAKEEKTKAEGELETEKGNEATKQSELEGFEQRRGEIEQEVLKADSELAQQVSEIDTKITNTKTKQNTEVTAIDNRIQELKSQEMDKSKFKGKINGETTEVAKRAFEIASDPEYQKEVLGRDKCVIFAAGAINRALKEFGINFQIPEQSTQLNEFAKKHNIQSIIQGSEAQRTATTQGLRPGDLFKNGNRHVGMVAEVYPDGTYRTIEGGYSLSRRDEKPTNTRVQYTYSMSDLMKLVSQNA